MKSTKIIVFEHEFDCSEWIYENMMYKFYVPRLQNKSQRNIHEETSLDVVENTLIHYQHKQGRCQTNITIHLPQNINIKSLKIDSDVITIQHFLFEPLWKITVDLCKFSLKCDMNNWMSSWESLKTITRQFYDYNTIINEISKTTHLPYDICEVIADKSIFTLDDWSQGVNDFVLFHIHYALSQNIIGANTLFEKVLLEGGLTKKNIMHLIDRNVIKQKPSTDWICVKVKKEDDFCIHRRLFELFDLNINHVKNEVKHKPTYPIDEYYIEETYEYRW